MNSYVSEWVYDKITTIKNKEESFFEKIKFGSGEQLMQIEIWDAAKDFCKGSPIINNSRAFKRVSG